MFWIGFNCNYQLCRGELFILCKEFLEANFELQLDQDEQSSSTTSMRQKENLETFLESLLMMDDPGYKSESTHTSLPPMSRFPPTNETLNSNLLSQDIIEIKTLLVKVKTLLEKVRHWRDWRDTIYITDISIQESQEDLIKVNDCEQGNERRILEDEIAKMKSLLSEKDQKIEQLEKIINSKKENVSTQVSCDQIFHNNCKKKKTQKMPTIIQHLQFY